MQALRRQLEPDGKEGRGKPRGGRLSVLVAGRCCGLSLSTRVAVDELLHLSVPKWKDKKARRVCGALRGKAMQATLCLGLSVLLLRSPNEIHLWGKSGAGWGGARKWKGRARLVWNRNRRSQDLGAAGEGGQFPIGLFALDGPKAWRPTTRNSFRAA